MTDITVDFSTIDVTVEMLTPDVTVEVAQPKVEVTLPTGMPGVDGVDGAVGPPGPPGFSNAVYTGQWRWTTKTTDAAQAGQVGNDVQTGWASTALHINEQKDDNTDVSAHFFHIHAGDQIRIQQKTDGTKWVLHEITGDGTDRGTWWEFPVITIDHGNQPPNNNAEVIVTHGVMDESAQEVYVQDTDPGDRLIASVWIDTSEVAPVAPTWWAGTQTAYNALVVKDPDTMYIITGP